MARSRAPRDGPLTVWMPIIPRCRGSVHGYESRSNVPVTSATDLDNDPFSYTVDLSKPGHLSGNGTNYLYQPKPGFLGKDEFTFQAFDGKDLSRLATVSITVTDQNTPPAAQDFIPGVTVNTPDEHHPPATDLESDPLTFHVVTRPLYGKLNGKGAVMTYSPNAYFTGSDRFTFKANDGELDSNVVLFPRC